jgi:hypothetical protein
MLPVAFYGYETYPLTLREEHGLRVSDEDIVTDLINA